MPSVALVTATAALGTDDDLEPLLAALAAAGVDADAPCWDDPEVEWGAYRLVVMRSPWDYVPRYAEFLAWLDRVEALAPVLNPPATIRWSTDKRYLADLATSGVPVVPTTFLDPNDSGAAARALDALGPGEHVVKPTVSAGSKDTMRHSTPGGVRDHARALLNAGRGVMVQPYLAAIDTYGETGLVYFDAELSHAFRKAPILALDAPPTDEFYAPEEISGREPSAAERAVGAATIAACGGSELLYGRVDLVPGPDGAPLVLEVELAEPSYFVRVAPTAAGRFAAAVRRRLR